MIFFIDGESAMKVEAWRVKPAVATSDSKIYKPVQLQPVAPGPPLLQ
jgi:hypothetical protein